MAATLLSAAAQRRLFSMRCLWSTRLAPTTRGRSAGAPAARSATPEAPPEASTSRAVLRSEATHTPTTTPRAAVVLLGAFRWRRALAPTATNSVAAPPAVSRHTPPPPLCWRPTLTREFIITTPLMVTLTSSAPLIRARRFLLTQRTAGPRPSLPPAPTLLLRRRRTHRPVATLMLPTTSAV